MGLDVTAPVIKDDSEYPSWLSSIAGKVQLFLFQPLLVKTILLILHVFIVQAPSKSYLDKKYETEGVDAMTMYEIKRLKKLLSRGEIKAKNASKILDTES